MISVFSKALDTSIPIDRVIGKINGTKPGPTLIFFGGIHGNEPAGVFALQQAIDHIQKNDLPVSGNLYAIAGNLNALSTGQRYIDLDLNRIWTDDHVGTELTERNQPELSQSENNDLIALLSVIRKILKEHKGPFYFFDLHTTSSQTIPFITINDTRLNRKLALHYPVPVILGIEEHLDGPLLSFINKLGYIAIGFESGQHDSVDAIENHLAFIYHTMVITGSLSPNGLSTHCAFVPRGIKERRHVFEIIHRHRIINGEQFYMNRGFVNFQNIKRGEPLAFSNNKVLEANTRGKIFMPLYQSMGDDGYFIIKRIPWFFLKLSSLFRKIRMDVMLTWLPGITWGDVNKKTLRINLRVARFLAKDFLHLMGYRVMHANAHYLTAIKREDHESNLRYKNESWTTRDCIKLTAETQRR